MCGVDFDHVEPGLERAAGSGAERLDNPGISYRSSVRGTG